MQYGKKKHHANLYNFITAPAASGKGVLQFAEMLGNTYDNKIMENSRTEKLKYEAELRIFKKNQFKQAAKKGASSNSTPDEEEPIRPPFRTLYIPANASSAMIIKHLNENNGCGIICESEADTMGNVLKQDWGGYSDLLRKAFHFEKITYSRKATDEFIKIERPQLSVVLSGTPNQILKLIPSAEDGLFSRFLFYAFADDVVWQPMFNEENDNYDVELFFQQQGEKVLQVAEFFEKYPLFVKFTREQWAFSDTKFEKLLHEVNLFNGRGALSIVKRLAINQYRIAMILTALHHFTTFEQHGILPNTNGEKNFCTDFDLVTAFSIVEVCLRHAILIFESLPKAEGAALVNFDNKKRRFLEALPEQFDTNTAYKIGEEQLQIKNRQVRNYIKDFLEVKYITKSEWGTYHKK